MIRWGWEAEVNEIVRNCWNCHTYSIIDTRREFHKGIKKLSRLLWGSNFNFLQSPWSGTSLSTLQKRLFAQARIPNPESESLKHHAKQAFYQALWQQRHWHLVAAIGKTSWSSEQTWAHLQRWNFWSQNQRVVVSMRMHDSSQKGKLWICRYEARALCGQTAALGGMHGMKRKAGSLTCVEVLLGSFLWLRGARIKGTMHVDSGFCLSIAPLLLDSVYYDATQRTHLLIGSCEWLRLVSLPVWTPSLLLHLGQSVQERNRNNFYTMSEAWMIPSD